MANTLKFGAGNWATKEGSTLAYNDESDNYKPLPFDFTRASSATVVNKAGLIETVGNAIPRIDFLGNTQGALKLEPQRTNLIPYSSDFPNSYWVKSGATIQGDPSTAGSELVTNGDFATDSDWTKLGNTTISGGKLNIINSNGTVATQSNVWEVGKTYKVTVQCTFVSGNRIILPYDGGNIAKKVTTPSTETYTYYYSPSTTTLYIYSDGNGNGSIDNVSVKEVQGFTSPDGTNNSYKLVEGTSNGNHQIYSGSFGGSAGNNYTTSFFVKAAERTWCRILNFGGTSVFFDLANGVVGTELNASGKIEALSNGWYKVSSTYVSQPNERAYLYLAESDNTTSYQGNGTSGIYVFGGQAEQGSYSTSYISTSGSSVTRLADACSQTPPSGVIGQTEGTLYGEFDFKDNSTGTRRLLCLTDGTTSNRITTYVRTADELSLFIVSGGVAQSDISTTALTDGIIKYAVSYANNNIKIYLNGTQVGTDTSATIPLTSKLFVGTENGNLPSYFNWINCELYNTALTDAELATLTTI